MHMMDSGFTNFIRRVYVTIKYRNNWPLRLYDPFDDAKAALMRFRADNVIAEIAEVDKMRAELLAKDHNDSEFTKRLAKQYPQVRFPRTPEFFRELDDLVKKRKRLLKKLAAVTTGTSRCRVIIDRIKRQLAEWRV